MVGPTAEYSLPSTAKVKNADTTPVYPNASLLVTARQFNQNFLYHTTSMLFGITHRKHGTGYSGFFAFLQLTRPTVFLGV